MHVLYVPVHGTRNTGNHNKYIQLYVFPFTFSKEVLISATLCAHAPVFSRRKHEAWGKDTTWGGGGWILLRLGITTWSDGRSWRVSPPIVGRSRLTRCTFALIAGIAEKQERGEYIPGTFLNRIHTLLVASGYCKSARWSRFVEAVSPQAARPLT